MAVIHPQKCMSVADDNLLLGLQLLIIENVCHLFMFSLLSAVYIYVLSTINSPILG